MSFFRKKITNNTKCINTTCKLRKQCARYCGYDFTDAHRSQSGMSFTPHVIWRGTMAWKHECEYFIGLYKYKI